MGLSYNDLLDKPTIPNVSGKEDKSNKVTSLSSSSTDTQYPSAKCVYDELIYKSDIDHTHTIDNQFIQESTNPVESRVISAAIFALEDAIAGKASSSHSHTTAQVKDSSAYSNLGTSANATQATINSAINTKIGALLSVELVTVVSSLPTASASTMNKLYLTPESTSATNDKYKIYVTVKNGNTYAWEKVDTARIDLSNYTTFSNVDSEIDAYLSALITALES